MYAHTRALTTQSHVHICAIHIYIYIYMHTPIHTHTYTHTHTHTHTHTQNASETLYIAELLLCCSTETCRNSRAAPHPPPPGDKGEMQVWYLCTPNVINLQIEPNPSLLLPGYSSYPPSHCKAELSEDLSSKGPSLIRQPKCCQEVNF